MVTYHIQSHHKAGSLGCYQSNSKLVSQSSSDFLIFLINLGYTDGQIDAKANI